ncbi:hypothetical protein_gp209 [Bacillus phage vB_BceM_WH1]|nr:hypothetical protein_gp209 [Bacillus phage vB_BceM_WH1]
MKNLFAGVKGQFGKVENVFAFSPVTGGLAVKVGNGQFVAFQDGQLVDVQGLTLDFKVPAFKLPVVASEVQAGDIVLNGAEYLYVTGVSDNYVEAVSPARREKVNVLPTTNLFFGKPFFTVVRTMDGAGAGFDPTMLLLMSDGGNKEDLLPFLLMSGGLGGAQAAGQINPMMLMALQDSTDDLLPLLLMQQGGAMGEGFNPLMLLAMGEGKGGKLNDLLPLMMMQGGGAAGAMNPMMMMMLMGDGKGGDMKDIMMMQALSGGNGFNLFGAK